MATILLAWELGGGLGHLVPLRCLGQTLVRRGHRVIAALRDLSSAGAVFDGTGIDYLQAPVKLRVAEDRINPLLSAAHILHNTGFADPRELGAHVHAWTMLLEAIEPDLVVADHAPTALLALRGYPAKATALATGFSLPPNASPLPVFLPELPCDAGRLTEEEGRVLASANAVLQSRGLRPLQRLSQLFHEVDETFLATFAELDHYGQREGVRYWGPCWESAGDKVDWPSGDGPRVFAYLKPFPHLTSVLAVLQRFELPAVVVVSRPGREILERFSCRTMCLRTQPVDIDHAARQCELAILNAGHGATAAMLLAGRPVVQIPLMVEQAMVARHVEQLGAGILAAPGDPQKIVASLEMTLSRPSFAAQAKAFADRYANYDPRQTIESIADRIGQLLGS